MKSKNHGCPTPRAADTATPCATGGGFEARVRRQPSRLDKHAVPLTPSLGASSILMEDDTNLQRLLNRLENRKFDRETCFLCARPLAQHGSTVEHVIPRWVQRRFKLWDQRLDLLNGTSIPYRQLTVPCCEECNKYRLQPIENLVLGAIKEGAEEVRALGNRVLFLWLGKIFYGLLYREVLLYFDRRDPTAGSIVPPEVIKLFLPHLIFLQEARQALETVDFTPGSIFVFNTQQPKDVQFQWDFVDNVDYLTIGVRLGKVGIIGSLADGGAQEMDPFFHPNYFTYHCTHYNFEKFLLVLLTEPQQPLELPNLSQLKAHRIKHTSCH